MIAQFPTFKQVNKLSSTVPCDEGYYVGHPHDWTSKRVHSHFQDMQRNPGSVWT